MRSFGWAVALAAIWVLMWGSASPANTLSGLAIGTLLVFVVPGLRQPGRGSARLRPVAIARLVGYVLVNTVRSNAELTREVLSPSTRLRTGIIGVPLPSCSDDVVTLLSDLLALSPGTMPVEVRTDPLVLYVHVLHLADVEQVRRQLLRLTALTVAAFGSERAVAELAASAEVRR